jgi:4'-phosphopantetheinyl transferase
MADGMPPQESWPRAPLGAREVHLWRIALETEASPLQGREDAAARARHQRAQSRLALLRILSHCTGLPAADLRFEADALGKPRLALAGAPAFNLSHARGMALVAVSGGAAVGVDVEQVHGLRDVLALAQRFLTPTEAAAVVAATTAPGGRDLAFLRAWTRKEAVLKASGHGLSLETSAIETGTGPADGVVTLADAAGACRYRVQSVPMAPSWVGAVAVALPRDAAEAAPTTLRCHDLVASTERASPRTAP